MDQSTFCTFLEGNRVTFQDKQTIEERIALMRPRLNVSQRDVLGMTRGVVPLLAERNVSGITVGENRVHRLCRIAGITASHHKKRSKPGSTGPAPHDDLLAVVDEHGVVRHEFAADAPNKVWLWDIERHEALLNLAVVKGHRSAPVAAGV